MTLTLRVILVIISFSSSGFAGVDQLIAQANHLGLANHSQWLRLGHYKKNLFGGYTSEADGLSFFVATNGKHDPKAELEATIRGFFDSVPRKFPGTPYPDQTVSCQFPARRNFLSEALGYRFPDMGCDKYTDFKRRLDAKSVTLVFSSFFLNKPASAFGHSLLRFNKADEAKGEPHFQLLDYGVNYAANPNTSNPLTYALYGTVGLFRGSFTAMPYFYKVREYNDFESRDLWEYDLVLNANEIDQLVAHLWELGFTEFDYFYFTSNCSYQLLSLLEAASPRLHLIEKIPLWVIPTDTVKAIAAEEGLVSKVKLRPSVYSQLQARLKQFDKLETEDFFRVVENWNTADIKTDNQQSQARVLDAALDYFDYRYAHEILAEKEHYKSLRHKLLIHRSQLPSLSNDPQVVSQELSRPDHGHDSTRFGLGVFRYSNLETYTLDLRFAFHDFADSSIGFPETAFIEFFRLQGQYIPNTSSLNLTKFTLFDVRSISSLSRLEKPLAWRASIDSLLIEDGRCAHCYSISGTFGAGAAVSLVPRMTTYLLGVAQFDTSPSFEGSKLTVKYGPSFGLRWVFMPQLIFWGEYNYFKLPFEEKFAWQMDSALRYSFFKSVSAELNVKTMDNQSFAGARIFYYF